MNNTELLLVIKAVVTGGREKHPPSFKNNMRLGLLDGFGIVSAVMWVPWPRNFHMLQEWQKLIIIVIKIK